MTCRDVRRGAGAASVVLWSASVMTAVGMMLRGSDASPVLVLLLSASITATVLAGVGFFLAKGSAEAVFAMGVREGRRLQLEECAGKADDTGGRTVLAFPRHRSGVQV